MPGRMKLIFGAAILLSVAASCAGAKDSASGGNFPTSSSGGSPGTGTGTGGSTGSADAGGPPLPPETEVESSYEVPVATGSYIWVANPDSGRVAYVAARDAAGPHRRGRQRADLHERHPQRHRRRRRRAERALQDATILRVAAGGQLTKSTVERHRRRRERAGPSRRRPLAIAWTDAPQRRQPPIRCRATRRSR